MRHGFQLAGFCDQMKGMLSDERDSLHLFSPHIMIWEYLKGYVLQMHLKGLFNKFDYFSASVNINYTFLSLTPCYYDWVLAL